VEIKGAGLAPTHPPRRLGHKRCDPRQHIVNDVVRRLFNKAAIARGDINRPQLIAKNHTGGFRIVEIDSKAAMAREVSAIGDGRYKLHAERIKRCRRDNDNGAMAALFTPRRGVEVDEIDCAPFH
jgi:hypothetical protein